MTSPHEAVYVIAAVFLFPVVPTVHIISAWLLGSDKSRVFPPLAAIVVYVISWGVVISTLVDAPWQFARGLLAAAMTIGILSLVYIDLFNLACMGFALRVLFEIYLNESMTAEELLREYGGGKGMDWFLQKRLAGLVSLRLVHFDGQTLRTTRFGTIVGRMGRTVKQVLGLKKGN